MESSIYRAVSVGKSAEISQTISRLKSIPQVSVCKVEMEGDGGECLHK